MNPALSLASPALYAVTHPGHVHHTNEDSWAVVETADGALLLVVCDGMGGMGHGDEASQLAVRSLVRSLGPGAQDPGGALLQTLGRLDQELRDALCTGGKGLPGTTAVVAWIRGNEARIGWVGDSRAYWIRDGAVLERTRDHKLVEELIAAGQLTEAEAKNSMLAHVVTRAIGGRSPDEPVVEGTLAGPWALRTGDRLVLISDGVCDLLSDEEIAAAARNSDPVAAGDALVRLALDRGGHDNITAIVLVAETGAATAPRGAARVLGTSVPEAPAPPAPAPVAASPRPASLPPEGRQGSPEEEFRRLNRDYTPLWVGAMTMVTLTVGLFGWLILG